MKRAIELHGRPACWHWPISSKHWFESGVVKNHVELARLGQVSPSRVSQILLLLHLAPSIQEQVLFAGAAEGPVITEGDLRKLAREPRWDRQRVLFEGRQYTNGGNF